MWGAGWLHPEKNYKGKQLRQSQGITKNRAPVFLWARTHCEATMPKAVSMAEPIVE